MHLNVILFYAIATIILLIIARFVNQFIIKTNLTDILIVKDNPAEGVAWAGYVFAVFMIIAATLSGSGYDTLLLNIKWTAIFGIGGIIFLALIAKFGIQLITSGDTLKLIKEGNKAAGILLAGAFIAIASIISGAISGDIASETALILKPQISITQNGELISSSTNSYLPILVFFIMGLVIFFIITYLYRFLTAYNDSKEIANGNVAVALSYSGLMIGIAIVVGNALFGQFNGWSDSILEFLKALIVVVIFYPIRQWLVQGILLGAGFSIYGGRLDKEIGEQRNLAAGIIEAATYIATGILAVKLL